MIALISTETALCWQRAALGRFKVKSRVQGAARHTWVFLTGGNQVNRRRFIFIILAFFLHQDWDWTGEVYSLLVTL